MCQSAIVISVLVQQGVTIDNSIESSSLLSDRSGIVIEQQLQSFEENLAEQVIYSYSSKLPEK